MAKKTFALAVQCMLVGLPCADVYLTQITPHVHIKGQVYVWGNEIRCVCVSVCVPEGTHAGVCIH